MRASLQTVPRRALFAPIVFAGRQYIASRWPGIPSGRWGQLFPPRSAILVLSFLLHISFMLFLGTTLTLKPRTVEFLETNRSSVERKVPKLPAKFPERGHFLFFRSSSYSTKVLYELRIGRGEGERPQASNGILSRPWLVILKPKTAVAGTGGNWAARKPCLSYRARDTVCSWWGTPPPSPATTFCRYRRTLKCRTTSSTASATTGSLAQVTFTCPSLPAGLFYWADHT